MRDSPHAGTSRGPRSLGRIELAWLWCSYQRYAFLLGGAPIVAAVATLALAPHRWYFWIPLAIVAVLTVPQATLVYRRFPRKIRATIAARRRIARGTFDPRWVRNYCGDPCFRVVAQQILRDAGMSRAERRQLVRRFALEKRNEPDFVLFVDRANGVQIRVEGNGVQNWSGPR
jgi:hypothetical protein